MKKSSLFLLTLLILSLPALAQDNLSGQWVFNVETDMGSGAPTFDLKQDSEGKISGTYEGQLGSSDVTGTFLEGKFHLEFSIQGNAIVYDGEFIDGKLQGTVNLGGMATGTFVGTRKEE
ncbi:hypothetical protein ACFOSV_09710 [Algoriphagus namhaensis]|uniref:Uncharacterized protein n=1 Tax=Algoriphagus namhaensis TaxID=915353 RepID=A0ABV8AUD9_9BACT